MITFWAVFGRKTNQEPYHILTTDNYDIAKPYLDKYEFQTICIKARKGNRILGYMR